MNIKKRPPAATDDQHKTTTTELLRVYYNTLKKRLPTALFILAIIFLYALAGTNDFQSQEKRDKEAALYYSPGRVAVEVQK